jgi:hypothetical protein
MILDTGERFTMDRCAVGIILGAVGGIMSLLEFSLFFFLIIFSVKIVVYVIGWYLVAAGLALLVLWAALIAHKGRKVLGGRTMLATSLGAPITNLALLIIPGPVGSMIPILYYQPIFVSGWLLLSLIGGILILSTKTKKA